MSTFKYYCFTCTILMVAGAEGRRTSTYFCRSAPPFMATNGSFTWVGSNKISSNHPNYFDLVVITVESSRLPWPCCIQETPLPQWSLHHPGPLASRWQSLSTTWQSSWSPFSKTIVRWKMEIGTDISHMPVIGTRSITSSCRLFGVPDKVLDNVWGVQGLVCVLNCSTLLAEVREMAHKYSSSTLSARMAVIFQMISSWAGKFIFTALSGNT